MKIYFPTVNLLHYIGSNQPKYFCWDTPIYLKIHPYASLSRHVCFYKSTHLFDIPLPSTVASLCNVLCVCMCLLLLLAFALANSHHWLFVNK